MPGLERYQQHFYKFIVSKLGDFHLFKKYLGINN